MNQINKIIATAVGVNSVDNLRDVIELTNQIKKYLMLVKNFFMIDVLIIDT